MRKFKIGDALIIYLAIQILFVVAYRFDLFQSKLIAAVPTIILLILSVLLGFTFWFLTKYFNNGKDSWDNN